VWWQLVCRLENGVTGIVDKDHFADDDHERHAFAARVQVPPPRLLRVCLRVPDACHPALRHAARGALPHTRRCSGVRRSGPQAAGGACGVGRGRGQVEAVVQWWGGDGGDGGARQVDAVLQCVILSVAHAEFEVPLPTTPHTLYALPATAHDEAIHGTARHDTRRAVPCVVCRVCVPRVASENETCLV
jgi:hypothetical protein